ncbi:hypothetical protein [Mesorhizobium sp. M1B.F.Ca.ET.045.04.1.1]|uniref:hypothetical protein n=1 Tax=Mesorhizobium sp. M1B.F.Ca.ET.045.04.1.1 TaxID=2493673 RepID=UPI000F757690|nr:hypothetical protein [Mesorhizobium sp. M1B.F.Ca.ET.045.04.1.1]AZO27608.1 hypothetical protein EJ071_09365 [Mesorhizobium sp. M1B.F.Ca.ET.045.04.1.1]
MDPVSAILGALVAGATAAGSEVGSLALKEAYQGLRTILVDTYKVVSTALLEKKPSNTAYQGAVQDELRAIPEIANDPDLLKQAKAVQEAVSAMPADQVTALGIDIETLTSQGNLIAERIHGGIRGKSWSAAGDIRFSDVNGGKSSGNR